MRAKNQEKEFYSLTPYLSLLPFFIGMRINRDKDSWPVWSVFICVNLCPMDSYFGPAFEKQLISGGFSNILSEKEMKGGIFWLIRRANIRG
jgi:hypothetical protein